MLTVVIPTRNRPEFLGRVLAFLRIYGHCHTVIVADSSDPLHADVVTEIIARESACSWLEFRQYPGELPFYEKVRHALALVTTPFAVLGADDDFFIPEALEKAVSFLAARPEYSLVHGEGLLFETVGDAAYGPIRSVSRYLQRSVEQEDPVARLLDHYANYSTTWYSVQRTVELRRNWDRAGDVRRDVQFFELLPSGLSIIRGKARMIDTLYMVRQQVSMKHYVNQTVTDWTRNPGWTKRYEHFRTTLAGALVEQAGLDMAEAHRMVDQAFGEYLAKHRKTGLLGWMHRGARRSPLLRTLRDQLRRGPGDRNSGRELEYLLSPESPDASAFGAVYRLLLTGPGAAGRE
jgi:glycosyltransferase domain-containing protein